MAADLAKEREEQVCHASHTKWWIVSRPPVGVVMTLENDSLAQRIDFWQPLQDSGVERVESGGRFSKRLFERD